MGYSFDFWFELEVLILFLSLLMENNDFWTPRRKTMQNHYEITSKNLSWTRNLRNRTKTLTSVMSVPTLDSINYETHKGKYMEHI